MLQPEDLLSVFQRDPSWKWLVGKFLPSTLVCPRCGQPITGERARKSFLDLRRTFCHACGRKFSPTEGTPIHGTRWQPEEVVQLLFLSASGLEPSRIGKALEKSPATVRDMLERIELAKIRISGGSADDPPLILPSESN